VAFQKVYSFAALLLWTLMPGCDGVLRWRFAVAPPSQLLARSLFKTASFASYPIIVGGVNWTLKVTSQAPIVVETSVLAGLTPW